jgi:hypothetical protein
VGEGKSEGGERPKRRMSNDWRRERRLGFITYPVWSLELLVLSINVGLKPCRHAIFE